MVDVQLVEGGDGDANKTHRALLLIRRPAKSEFQFRYESEKVRPGSSPIKFPIRDARRSSLSYLEALPFFVIFSPNNYLNYNPAEKLD